MPALPCPLGIDCNKGPDGTLWYSIDIEFENAQKLVDDHVKFAHPNIHSRRQSSPMLGSPNPNSKKKIKAEKQLLRKFGRAAEENLVYKEGNYIHQETGASNNLLEPAREFKQFDGGGNLDSDKIDDLKIPFVMRVAKFANACLNKRCNGTIYFGVADGKNGNYRHGQIVGVPITLDVVEKFEEWIKIYLRGSNALCFKKITNMEIKVAVDMSISTIRIIEVASREDITDKIGVVLEIDVEPSINNTKDLIFPICLPLKNGEGGKNVDFYIREGANSTQVSKSKISQFQTECQIWINKRIEDERREKLKKGDVVTKLKEHFLRGETYINDEENKYFLITDWAIDDSKDIDSINWITPINWQAIFDFSPSDKSGLYNKIEESMLKQAKFYKVSQFADIIEKNNNEVTREKIGFGLNCNWLQCCEPDEDYKTWALKMKASIMKIIDFFASEKNVASKNKLVFIFAVETEDKMKRISELIKYINAQCEGLQNSVFISENNKIFQEYEAQLHEEIDSKDFNNHCVQINWDHLADYVKGNNRYRFDKDLKIPSSDVEIKIEKVHVDHFKKYGLEVLGINQCDELLNTDTNKEELEYEGYRCNEEFLKGKHPDWKVFMLANPNKIPFNSYSALVERDITNDLVEKIKVSSSEQKIVSIVGLNHHPGAGATTVGKHVLWKLKEDFRCGYIDQERVADLSDISKTIIQYSEYGEEKSINHPKPVLLFLDNSTFESGAKQLRKNIETSKSKLPRSHKIIILYSERMIFEKREERSTVFFLKYSLQPKEQSVFKVKLNNLVKDHQLNPQDMLSFVIMADGSENSEYVKKAVEEFLGNIDHTSRQAKLLLILSIYKYFFNGNLTCAFCEKYLGPTKTINLEKRICEEIKPFVEFKTCSENNFGHFQVLQVTHMPVAKQVFEFLSDNIFKTDVSKVLLDFLDENALKDVYGKQKTLNDISTLCCDRIQKKDKERTKKDDEDSNEGRSNFSQLIEFIQTEINSKSAHVLLEKAFNFSSVDNRVASRIAQTIARLYLSDNNFESAKKWATDAAKLFPAFYHYDTIGQIYKKELEKKKNSSKEDLKNALELGKFASSNFKIAQDLIENSQRKRHCSGINEEEFKIYSNWNHSYNTSYFGEIRVNLKIASLLIELTENPDVKKSITKYMQPGYQNENLVEDLFTEKILDWRQYTNFIRDIDRRTIHCMQQISKTFDSNTWKKHTYNHIEILGALRDKRETLFFGANCMFKLRGKTMEQNLESIRTALEGHQVFSMISVFHSKQLQLKQYRSFVNKLVCLCEEENLTKADKLYILNVAMAEYYIERDKKNQKEMEKLRLFSKQLVQLTLDVPEPYFYYMLFHWPNETEKKSTNVEFLETYDEDLMLKSVQQLQILFDKKSLFDSKNNVEVRRPTHLPLFFLSRGLGMKRLDVVPNGGHLKIYDEHYGTKEYKRKSLLGRTSFSNSKRIMFKFPEGKEIDIKPINPPFLRDNSQFQFDLGFTLRGPIAYNVKYLFSENQRIRALSD